MTEKEILERQSQNDNQSFFAIQIGMFYHAYEAGAFALAHITGYSVRMLHRRTLGDIHVCGFPVGRIDSVMAKMKMNDVSIQFLDEQKKLFEFGATDEVMVKEPLIVEPVAQPKTTENEQKILNALLSFNVAASTPMDAMILISKLQKDYEEV